MDLLETEQKWFLVANSAYGMILNSANGIILNDALCSSAYVWPVLLDMCGMWSLFCSCPIQMALKHPGKTLPYVALKNYISASYFDLCIHMR